MYRSTLNTYILNSRWQPIQTQQQYQIWCHQLRRKHEVFWVPPQR